ncbi:MAG: hypothetical protein NTZ27_11540 [Ignavibacteriales bacterium]|nr:hypothetical protein [Ignavibacteriales bacterium]
MSSISLPEQGIVFWPIGTGDSTTICIDTSTVIQIDLRHLKKSDDKEDPHIPIIDELIKILPKKDKNPFLALFVLTHPDKDHCQGFQELLNKIKIGEIWFTPRIFREYHIDLCDDASAFKKEAERRVKEMIRLNGNVKECDRVRIIGYDELLKDDEFKNFPKEYLSVPGHEITSINQSSFKNQFRAFVHSPFKDDLEGDRNETCLGLQITLKNSNKELSSLLLGDIHYEILTRIFDKSEKTDLHWNIFLAPHHCSKSVMYWKSEDDKEEKLKEDILEKIKKNADEYGYIISSSEPVPSKNKDGDNPPHALAKDRYEEIVPKDFICTMEYPNEKTPRPIIFSLDDKGININDEGKSGKSGETLSASITAARGINDPPSTRTGFGSYNE